MDEGSMMVTSLRAFSAPDEASCSVRASVARASLQERAELNDQYQIHQEHRDPEREQYATEHFVALGLAALGHGVAGSKGHSGSCGADR
jgi:hypothetical protein